MSTPKTNRLRRLGLPQRIGPFDPLRGGLDSDLKWVGGLPIGTSSACTPEQLGPGAQATRSGGSPVATGIPDIAESGSGCPSGSSNLASRSGAARFMVDEGHERTAASPPPRTTRHGEPFELRAGHGFDSGRED